MKRRRVLFISEAVTRQRVVTPVVLARALDPDLYDVHFAAAYRHEDLFKDAPLTYWPIESVSAVAFHSSMVGNRSAYDDDRVESYLKEEEMLLHDIEPDLVVSDTRWTAPISASTRGIPVATLANAYWSPFREDTYVPTPMLAESSLGRVLPPGWTNRRWLMEFFRTSYSLARPLLDQHFLAPFNRSRRRRRLKALGDIESLITCGDWTLYCDVPELTPVRGAPATHRFLGPVFERHPGSGAVQDSVTDQRCVCVVGKVFDDPWTREDVRNVLEKGGIKVLETDMSNEEADIARSRVVLCEGGSATASRALAAGKPVVGIPKRMDQLRAMSVIEKRGAGVMVRRDDASPGSIRAAVERVMEDSLYTDHARVLANALRSHDASQAFQKFMSEVLPKGSKGGVLSSPSMATLPGRLMKRAEQFASRPALWGLDERLRGDPPLSYSEAWLLVQSLAAGLKDMGLRKGESVGFLATVDPGWELMHQAVLLAGGVVVGLDLHDARERVQNAARQSEVCSWVVQTPAVAEEWRDILGTKPRFIIFLSGSSSEGVALTELREKFRGRTFEGDAPGPGDLATILFTSGTTGEPKGVAYTHQKLVHAVRAIVRAYGQLGEGFSSVCWLPLSNLFQRVVNLCSIERGALITFVPHPNRLADAMPAVQPDVLIGVPRFYEKMEAGIRKAVDDSGSLSRQVFWMCHRLARRYRKGRHTGAWSVLPLAPMFAAADRLVLARVRRRMGGRISFLVSGSAALQNSTLEFYSGLGIPILEAYGTSENAVPVSVNRPTSYLFGTTGQPLAPNEVTIREDREVLVKGPGVFEGYWKHPDPSASFHGSFYRTGDEGEWREGGFLKLMGRTSEFIKTSTGRRLSPGPSEAAFRELSFVDQAVLLGNGRKGTVLLVTIDEKSVIAKAGGSDVRETVAAGLRERAFRMPEAFRPLGVLVLNRSFSVLKGEMTANLKLRRRAIETNFRPTLDDFFKDLPDRSSMELPLRFLDSAELRMQDYRLRAPVKRIRAGALTRWGRLARMAVRGVGLYLAYARNLFRRPWDAPALRRDLLGRLVVSYRDTVGPLKGPLVKFGQTLSYVDLGLPEGAQKFLEDLQDTSAALAPGAIAREIEKGLGRSPKALFKEWHDTPVAAASISQIHLARLSDGRRVAVKVRYPGMDRVVRSDLLAVRLALPIISWMTGIDNVGENFKEGRRLLLGECDFRREAAFMKRFRGLFAGHPVISIPEVLEDYCADNVLTMEFVEGQTYAEFKATATAEEINRAGKAIYEFFVVSSHGNGLFNADPHPGNYLFRDGRVYFLDFGCCNELPKEFVKHWLNQMRSCIENDLEMFTEASKKMGIRRSGDPFDYAALLESYRSTVMSMNLKDESFQYTKEFLRAQTRALTEFQLGVGKAHSPVELLGFSRLFWGLHSLLADLGARVNFYRLAYPYIFPDR